jgi:ribosomal protein L12E/L44/L45/RPP1/RPP2
MFVYVYIYTTNVGQNVTGQKVTGQKVTTSNIVKKIGQKVTGQKVTIVIMKLKGKNLELSPLYC